MTLTLFKHWVSFSKWAPYCKVYRCEPPRYIFQWW